MVICNPPLNYYKAPASGNSFMTNHYFSINYIHIIEPLQNVHCLIQCLQSSSPWPTQPRLFRTGKKGLPEKVQLVHETPNFQNLHCQLIAAYIFDDKISWSHLFFNGHLLDLLEKSKICPSVKKMHSGIYKSNTSQ